MNSTIPKSKFYQPLVKMFGGKGGRQINKWILSHFPSNISSLHYLEGCVGGGSIFFNKPKPNVGFSEQINDLNEDLIYLYRDLRDDSRYQLLIKELNEIEYTEDNFKKALDESDDDWYLSVKTYVKYRMSRAGMGKDFCWSSRTRGGQPEALNSWQNSLKQLPEMAARLKNTRITCKDIITLLDSRRGRSDLFIYSDTPYLKSTRSSPNIYDHEFTSRQHRDLCDIVSSVDFYPKILISGYASEMYKEVLECNGFQRYELTVANHAAQNENKKKRVECVWRNY